MLQGARCLRRPQSKLDCLGHTRSAQAHCTGWLVERQPYAAPLRNWTGNRRELFDRLDRLLTPSGSGCSKPRLFRRTACQAQGPTGAGRLAQDDGANGLLRFISSLYQFSRPHTMLGTFVSVVSVSLLALQGSPVTLPVIKGMVVALLPALLMNICIVGLNQVYDVEIDKVNKPYLPLASGEFDMATGVRIVAATGASALILSALSGSVPLLCTVAGSLALGVVYSVDLPLMRWKQYPVLAAACVLSVRAVAVQVGFYLHMLLYSPPAIAPGEGAASLLSLLQGPLGFTMGFMFLFSIVIALFKDIPDTKGDVQADVRTLSVRLGVRRVFWICIGLLELAYLGAALYGASRPVLWSKALVVAGHGLLGALLWRHARGVDLTCNRSITDCYMFVWRLFYLEYLLIPLFR
uniref:Homogenitisate phytyltransferase n=1 Tax=Tetraselmis sp. GSL018 TaxID=582737 RepID=A0A061R0W1_9CHLO